MTNFVNFRLDIIFDYLLQPVRLIIKLLQAKASQVMKYVLFRRK